MRHLVLGKKILIILASLMLSVQAFATDEEIHLDKDYALLSNPVVPTLMPKGKIHVIEFFSFNCIHCKLIEPLIEQSLALDKRIVLEKIQIVYDITLNGGYAKLDATMQLLKLNKLYEGVFEAIAAGKDLNDMDQLKEFLVQNGMNKSQINKFMNSYNSFTVNAKVAEFKQKAIKYGITVTPTFIVADKYLIKPAQPERLVQVVTALVTKITTKGK